MGEKNRGDEEVKKNWLQYVTEQSWEPELLISGLAVYATLQLPAVFKGAYAYYRYNLQSGTGMLDQMLPMLIFSVFTTVAYVLAAAFITHFVVRAFWVGFIGLMSVYKDGIRYDDLPYSDFYKEQARSNLGSSEQMALRLDQVSSLIFSVAFALVLLMFGVAFLYFIFFLLYNVLKLFVSAAFFDAYITIASILVFVLIVAYVAAVYILNMKRFRNNERLARWHFKLSWTVNAVIMPLVYKPLQFIQLTFMSHISTKRFVTYYGVIFAAFFTVLIGVMLDSQNVNLLDTRSFYATRSSERHIESHEYDSSLDTDRRIFNATIEKPVIGEAMLAVFVPYPKRLDDLLKQYCDPVQVQDTLSKYERRRRINEANIACAERFFSFRVDDTISVSGELMFANHPATGQQGFRSYLDIRDIPEGRHTLFVLRRPVTAADSSDSEEGVLLSYETEIPFWLRK